MHYFSLEENQNKAATNWANSQYDFADIVLFLTDRHIEWGIKIYKLFCKKDVRTLLNYYSVDLQKIKNDLYINGKYVERGGDVYLLNYNPKRNRLIKTPKNLNLLAMIVYDRLLEDLEEICKNVYP